MKFSIRELLSNKYYILVVSTLSLILALLVIIPGCTQSSGYSNSSDEPELSSSLSSSSEDDDDDFSRLYALMQSDTENDNTIVDTIAFSTDTFGEHSMIVEKSGTYKFNAVNLSGSDKEVFWNIYVFDHPYKFGTNYMMKNFEPNIVTDGNLTLYKNQYVYCICSTNQYNYDNSSILAYLKIRFINEVDDSLHIAHSHNFEIKVEVSSCDKNGYIIYGCNCGETYIESTEPVDHEYEEIKTEPTCTKDGYTTFKCKNCGHEYVEPGAAATGHTFDSSNMQVTANKHEFICNACGEKISSVHDIKTTAFVTGITDSKGKVQYYSIIIKDVCSVCRYSNTLDTSNHEHIASSYSYDKTTQILKFTCSTCGQQEYKCDDIYLDYEIKDNVDNSSDNSSSDVSSDTSSSNTDSNIPDNNSSDKKNKFSK